MTPARIAELLQPFLATPGLPSSRCHSEPATAGEEPASLSDHQLQDISIYIDILLRWNSRINLTAIRDPEEIVTRHFGESFFAARHLFPRPMSREDNGPSLNDEPSQHRGRAALQGRVETLEEGGALAPATLADIGSGAGFPGIPIKLWVPQISVTLIESNHKKATFLREVARVLKLTDINILTVRVESLTAASFETVTLRAVERFESILPVAASLVAPGGRLALLIGSTQVRSVQVRLKAFSWSDELPIPNSRSRAMLVGCKSCKAAQSEG